MRVHNDIGLDGDFTITWDTKHDSKMLSQCICYTSETYQILSPVLFQQSLYVLLLIHRIFYLLVFALFLHALQYCIQAGAFAPPKKWLFSMVTWGIKCARARMAQARNTAVEYSRPNV